jgi:hypothetical protein
LAGILGLHAMMNQVRTDYSEINSKIWEYDIVG